MQALNGRRGSVFSIRLTDDERRKLERAVAQGDGPRSLGAWVLHQALAAVVVPARGRAGELPVTRGPLLEGPPVDRAAADTPKSKRVILDLCAGSGSWSEPYKAAGYDVRRITLPEHDVRTLRAPAAVGVIPARGVWGVLAAPPCSQFSLARNGHEKKSPRDLVRGIETVNACIRVIFQTSPHWWALENPVGLLGRFLGTPRDVWQPCDFGDPWTKRTAIWGRFALPVRGPFVRPRGSGPICAKCGPSRAPNLYCRNVDHRAITPPGFARAFFQANP